MSANFNKSLLDDLDTVLFDEATIRNRISALGNEINAVYSRRKLTVIAIINGALIFTADLIRELNIAIQLDCIRASSYRDNTTPGQSLEIIDSIQLNIKGEDVLLIDDILDTGNTLSKVSEKLCSMKPNSLKTCVLLDKKSRRSVNFEADFVGFEVPDEFVVGYGLDFAQAYRQIPCIGVLKKELTHA